MARDSPLTSRHPGSGDPKPTPKARVSPRISIAQNGSQHGSSDPHIFGTPGDTEVDFALRATEALETIVKALLTRFQQRGSSALNCRLLKANLSEYRVWLEHNRNNADPSYFFEGLAVLEDICKVNLPSYILLQVRAGH
jgi:hypothetical protein